MRYVLVKWDGQSSGPMLHTQSRSEWINAIREVHKEMKLVPDRCRIISRGDTMWFDFQTVMKGKNEEVFCDAFFMKPKFHDVRKFLEENIYARMK